MVAASTHTFIQLIKPSTHLSVRIRIQPFYIITNECVILHYHPPSALVSPSYYFMNPLWSDLAKLAIAKLPALLLQKPTQSLVHS